MMKFRKLGILAGLALGVSVLAVNAYASEATVPPVPPDFPAEGKINYVARDSCLLYTSDAADE